MSTSATAPVGKWVIVRSDRLVVSVDKTNHTYFLGRGRQLPAAQLLSHKYASREHLAMVWHPPHLCMVQVGKNPSFLGASCTPVPRLRGDATTTESEENSPPLWQRAQVRFRATAAVKEATAHQSAGDVITVDVPLSDPLTVTHAPDRHWIGAATVHFPDELGLPTLTVRFEETETTREDATAAVTTKTTAEMLTVPLARAVGGDDDDDDDGLSDGEKRAGLSSQGRTRADEGAAADDGSGKPEWRGLLDVALQQQQQREGTSVSSPAAQAYEARPASQHVPAAFAPSTKVSVGSVADKTPPPSAAAADPAPHRVGLWEWKNHGKGKDNGATSWSKYNLAVAQLLEEAYRDASIATIKIPDSAMFGKAEARGYTYGVCFAEKALDGAMIQYSLELPGNFCLIRRTGGPPVDRRRAKKAHVIPTPPSSEDEESDGEADSSDDSYSEESVSSSSSSSSISTDGTPQWKKRRRR
ncbi:hypothetical protein LPMP_281310 [Leishmania panamensis]|uniref:FHA domain-containing protein n=1 Tax=Leishmania panamensis TaxID=5679 RepID=A0A088RWY5_LEIPA|nr:hypothetical protein LPMP_281310 [Leishmania panamensis]AIN99764.1 hypothetical protein LPMP_281310 [Leishmania panamensis]